MYFLSIECQNDDKQSPKMKMIRVVLLIGRKGAGKDTLAKMIEHELAVYDITVKRLAFAYKMKNILRDCFNFDDLTYFNDHDKKERIWPDNCAHMTPRDLMVWFGTTIREKFGENFWISTLQNEIEKNEKNTDTVFILTDTRFINEVTSFCYNEKYTCAVVYINADARIGTLSNNVTSGPEYAVTQTYALLAENNIPHIEINNNDDIDELASQARMLSDTIIKEIHIVVRNR